VEKTTISRVERRFNDVLYCIRTSPRGKPFLAHVDRLRKYTGEVPGVWKSAPKLLCESRPALGNEVVGEADDSIVPPVIQESSTAPVNENTVMPR
jgi:hypothetical protein